MASRGCKEDLPYGMYDWDQEFRRCPWSLFDVTTDAAYGWWRTWSLTKEGPFAARLADNPAYVRQTVLEFEHARLKAEAEANKRLEESMPDG